MFPQVSAYPRVALSPPGQDAPRSRSVRRCRIYCYGRVLAVSCSPRPHSAPRETTENTSSGSGHVGAETDTSSSTHDRQTGSLDIGVRRGHDTGLYPATRRRPDRCTRMKPRTETPKPDNEPPNRTKVLGTVLIAVLLIFAGFAIAWIDSQASAAAARSETTIIGGNT